MPTDKRTISPASMNPMKRNPRKSNLLSRSDSDSSNTGKTWQSTGFCPSCGLEIEALQPGGLSPQHIESKIPYGECDKAKRLEAPIEYGKLILPEGTLERAQEFNDRHRAILDAYDTLDPKNWEYHPAADGNKGYRVFIPFKGLK